MKKFMMIVASLLFATSASAGFPKIPGTGGGDPAAAQAIDKFIASATAADALALSASMTLAKAVSSKEAVEKIEALEKAAAAATDPKEKEAKQKEIAAATAEALKNQTDWAAAAKDAKSNQNAEKWKSVKGALKDLAGVVVTDRQLVTEGQKLAKTKPDLSLAPKLASLGDALGKITNQLGSVTGVLSNAGALMTSVGVEKLPEASAGAAEKSDKF